MYEPYPVRVADAAAVAWEEAETSELEKDLSVVVRQLPVERLGCREECPVCLTVVVGSLDSWVLFPCSHGVCSCCFERLVASQACTCFPISSRRIEVGLLRRSMKQFSCVYLGCAVSIADAKLGSSLR